LEGNSGFQGKNEPEGIDLGFDLRFPQGRFDFFEALYDWLLSLVKLFCPQCEKFLGSEKLFLAWGRSNVSPGKSNVSGGKSNPSWKKLFEGPEW